MYCARKQRAGTLTDRDQLYRFLAAPSSSNCAMGFAAFIVLISAVSVFFYGYKSTQQAKFIRECLVERKLNVTELQALTAPLGANHWKNALERLNAYRGWNSFLNVAFAVELLLRFSCY